MLAAAHSRTMIAGLGVTGLSVARHLRVRNEPFVVWDTAPPPAALEELRATWPDVTVISGELDPQACAETDTIIVSPGVPLNHPALSAASQAGAQIYGDIELFAHEVNAPVLGITGSNGKSTVTLWVAHLLEASGKTIRCGGNLGEPALSLLSDPAPDAYVLELSSFQLEATETLQCKAAALLNISPEHLDRHGSFEAYRDIKHRLYRFAETAVFNRQDSHTRPGMTSAQTVSFGLDVPVKQRDFGLREHEGQMWLCRGWDRLLPAEELSLAGQHNLANALAALALVEAFGVEPAQAASALSTFQGPPHRLQKVATVRDVHWYNDSKATNLDAMQAALTAFEQPSILIAGGRAKQDDWKRATAAVARHVRAMVLIGEAAEDMAQAWGEHVPTHLESDMEHAVARASQLAQPGENVLLSPGCASFDQYDNFEARGDDFIACVQALEASDA